MPSNRPLQTSPTGRGRPSVERAGRLSDDIMDHATRLFIRQGFGATSVEAIAAAVGISKKTFYTRFSGKAEVFEAAVMRYVGHHLAVPEASTDPNMSLEARLYALSCELLAWILQPDVLGLYRVTVAEAQRFPQLARAVVDFAILDAARSFEPVFRAWSAKPADDADIAFIASQFLQCVASEPFHRAVQGADPPGLDDVRRDRMRRAIRLFLEGFSQRPAPAGSPLQQGAA